MRLIIIVFSLITSFFGYYIFTYANPLKNDHYEPPLVSLIYHHISPKDSRWKDQYKVSITPEQFDANLKFLKENNFHFVNSQDVYGYLVLHKKLPPRSVMITFDDGYDNNYVWAYPILKKYGAKATIFVVSGSIESSPQAYDPHKTKHLSWTQLKEMYKSGLVDVQSHTHENHWKSSHGLYANQQQYGETEDRYEKRIYADLKKSKETIEKNLGNKVISIAWPYGYWNKKTLSLAKEAGYLVFWTTSFGTVDEKDHRTALPRVPVDDERFDLKSELTKAGYRF